LPASFTVQITLISYNNKNFRKLCFFARQVRRFYAGKPNKCCSCSADDVAISGETTHNIIVAFTSHHKIMIRDSKLQI